MTRHGLRLNKPLDIHSPSPPLSDVKMDITTLLPFLPFVTSHDERTALTAGGFRRTGVRVRVFGRTNSDQHLLLGVDWRLLVGRQQIVCRGDEGQIRYRQEEEDALMHIVERRFSFYSSSYMYQTTVYSTSLLFVSTLDIRWF